MNDSNGSNWMFDRWLASHANRKRSEQNVHAEKAAPPYRGQPPAGLWASRAECLDGRLGAGDLFVATAGAEVPSD